MYRVLLLAALVLPGHPASAASVRADHGMVASEHRLASEAGLRLLQQGGNAVDAAIAASLAAGVVNPTSCGIGGGGFMLIFDRRRREVFALDYRESAPAAAAPEMFVRNGAVVSDLSLHGGLAVAVPGEVAGLAAALKRFGTLPWRAVARPAIEYARDGFAVEAHLAEAVSRSLERIRERPALAAILLHPDGSPLQTGQILRQPHLARTLESIADEGPRAFYEGPVAEAIASAVRSDGGVLDRGDLVAYRPVWRRPLRGRFHGYEIYGMPPPSSGGGVILTILNQLRTDDLTALGLGSCTYLHLLAESMQFAFADRAALYGDPDFTDVPLARLLSPARGLRLRRLQSAATTFSPRFYGDFVTAADSGTSHLSIVDADGNAVACTTSINTTFGSMVVAGDTGIILNDTMDDFSARPGAPNVFGLVGSEANAIAPGKRPLSSMSPTIAMRGGEVAAVAGASGGPFIISGTLQALLDSLVFGRDAEAAVSAPRIHHQWMPPTLVVEPGIDALKRLALRRLGHRIVEVPGIGAVQLVLRSPSGALEGAADPRKGGRAAGW
jgi:gamma-glutamyltranspeptidase/glutathione hydrolase